MYVKLSFLCALRESMIAICGKQLLLCVNLFNGISFYLGPFCFIICVHCLII